MTTAEAISQLQSIPLDKILPSPFQTRKQFDEVKLQELAQTLEKHGLMNAIVVRKVGEKFELIAGERRVRAAKLLGWPTIEAKVEQVDDREAAEQVVVENLQRDDLNPIELAEGYKKLKDMGLTQEDIAKRVGCVDRSKIGRFLALLELPLEIQDIVSRDTISEGHIRYLSRIKDQNHFIQTTKQASREGWSVRETERRVLDLLEKTYVGARHAGHAGHPGKPPSPQQEATQYLADEGIRFVGEGKWVEVHGRWDRTMFPEEFLAKLRAAMLLWSSGHPFDESSDPATPETLPDGIDPELIRLAQQGPKALYAKLYGPNHKLTQIIGDQTWADMGGTWQEGLKTLLQERGKE